MFFKAQEVWKLMYHYDFQNKKNMHFLVTIDNSHKKSWLSFVPKRALFLTKVIFKEVNFSLYDLLLFWKRFLCEEIKQSLLKILRDFCLISCIKIILKIITKMNGKIKLHTKGILKGIYSQPISYKWT